MIDFVVDAIMIVGTVMVSVPVLLFAVVGLMHMAHSVYRCSASDLT